MLANIRLQHDFEFSQLFLKQNDGWWLSSKGNELVHTWLNAGITSDGSSEEENVIDSGHQVLMVTSNSTSHHQQQ